MPGRQDYSAVKFAGEVDLGEEDGGLLGALRFKAIISMANMPLEGARQVALP